MRTGRGTTAEALARTGGGPSAARDPPAAAPSPPRDLSPRWYLFALGLYVGLALASLSLRDNVLLLNWIVGPLFPVIVLYAIPTGVRSLLGRRAAR